MKWVVPQKDSHMDVYVAVVVEAFSPCLFHIYYVVIDMFFLKAQIKQKASKVRRIRAYMAIALSNTERH